MVVKLGFRERQNKEQLGNSEPFPRTNMPVHLITSEQIGFSEKLCHDQKVTPRAGGLGVKKAGVV